MILIHCLWSSLVLFLINYHIYSSGYLNSISNPEILVWYHPVVVSKRHLGCRLLFAVRLTKNGNFAMSIFFNRLVICYMVWLLRTCLIGQTVLSHFGLSDGKIPMCEGLEQILVLV